MHYPKPNADIEKAIKDLHGLLNDEDFWKPAPKAKPVPLVIEFTTADVAFLASVGMKP